jgi:phosphate transport system substrate-binding protein
MKPLTILGVIVVIAVAGLFWVSGSQLSTVQVQQKGSDTLLFLAQGWAEAYMAVNGSVEVVVSGGGTGTGITSLINRMIDIADASREIKGSEVETAREAGVDPVEWVVAIDGISIVLNKANPVSELSYDQLRGIYNGSVRNWSEVGGEDGVVIAYGRQSTSGTYVYFNEEVLSGDDFRTDTQQLAGSSEIVEAVVNDPNGIGYVGVAYSEARRDEVRTVSVRKAEGEEAYQPTAVNIASGDYPISRYLYVYTDGVPQGAVAGYLKFILSGEGQRIAEKAGFIELPQEILDEQLAKLG